MLGALKGGGKGRADNNRAHGGESDRGASSQRHQTCRRDIWDAHTGGDAGGGPEDRRAHSNDKDLKFINRNKWHCSSSARLYIRFRTILALEGQASRDSDIRISKTMEL